MRRGTFESLEARLALAADLGFAGAFEVLGGPATDIYSSSGSMQSRGGGMVTDGAGNRYVTVNGTYDHILDLDPGPAVQAVTMDAALVKLDPNGSPLWTAALNATLHTSPVVRILHAVDADENVYLVGDFRGTVDFDPGPGVTNVTSSQAGAEYSVYFAKLNSAGALQWVRKIDGAGLRPDRFALDGAGNLLIAANFSTGTTAAPIDVDPGPGQTLVQQKAANGNSDLLALKYSPNGDFVWVRQFGGIDTVMSASLPSLAVDGQGDFYLGRGFGGSIDLDPGAAVHLATNPDSASDGFVVKLDASGAFQWAYVTEGIGGAQFREIEIAGDGSIIVAGYLKGDVDFRPGSGTLQLASVGSGVNGLVIKVNSDSSIAWARRFGSGSAGNGETLAMEADVDQEGNVYLGGSFGRLATAGQTFDFDPGPDVYELITPSTQETGYVLSLTGTGDFRWAVPLGGNAGLAQVQGVSVTVDGSVQLSGSFKGNADFDPDAATQYLLNSGSSQSVFTATLTQVTPDPGAPVVDAGAGQTILINATASLHGTVSDDGLPNPVTTTWSLLSGPGAVTFGNASALDTTASISAIGDYLLKLEATDGQFTTADYVRIVVNPLTASLTTTADTYLDGGSKTTNFGTSPSLLVDGNPDNGALLSWNLSGIPVGSTLQSATLSVNVTGTSADTYEIYELKRSWNETQATWNKATASVNWQSAGAQGSLDRGTTVLGTITATATGVRNVVLNAAGLAVVQRWVNNPATNFGFVIQDYVNTIKDDLIISSKNDAVAANRPQLQLVYIPPSPPAQSLRSLAVTAPVNLTSNKAATADTVLAGLAGKEIQPNSAASPKATLAQRRDARQSIFAKIEWKAEQIASALHSAKGPVKSELGTIARDSAAGDEAFSEVGEPLTSLFRRL
ncbi:MAG: hypothetical protein C0485_13960 [Pirellula sp.]|nr:hypothetical protein [Pirellula sp.]